MSEVRCVLCCIVLCYDALCCCGFPLCYIACVVCVSCRGVRTFCVCVRSSVVCAALCCAMHGYMAVCCAVVNSVA